MLGEVIIQDRVVAEPFLYDENSNKEPVEFQIFFRIERYEYRYYLAILNDKISGEVLDRRMIGAKKPARIFEREKGEIDLGTLLKKEGVNTNINEKMPFLSFLAINV